MRWILPIAAVLLMSAAALRAEEKAVMKTPVELGDIPWERDFDKALARAQAEKKPLLVLFQEVPG